jgi:Family of unknown function (DUF6158)
MTGLAALLDSHPLRRALDNQMLADTIAALQDCAQACVACADACMSEPDAAALTGCVRLNLDCADVCATTARVLSRSGATSEALLDACGQTCRACAEECARHAGHHEHCRICAQACRVADQACWEYLMTAFAGPEGVPAGELPEDDLMRELAQIHRTRQETFLHASESAVENHTQRMTELEAEYLSRHPDRTVDARRTRAGARAA